MERRLQFKRHFRWEVIPNEGVFLLSEKKDVLLRGSAFIKLAPLLNGQHTEDEIVERLQDQVSALEIFYTLELLHRDGYIVDATRAMPPEQAAFWDIMGVEPDFAARRLQEVTVSVVSFGRINPLPFKAILESLGVCLGDKGELWIALTDDYLQQGLDVFNQENFKHNRPWLLVKPVGTELWFGPVFIPNQTGCWECLAHRLRGHRKVEGYLQEKKRASGPFPKAISVLPSTLQTAYALAATEIVKWVICGENKQLEGKVMTFDTLSLEKRNHLLVRRPQCSSCGDPDAFKAGQSAPLVLQSRRKSFITDGGHRSLSPEEAFKKLEHHISPITGIVSILRPISTGGDEKGLTPAYLTDHNFALADDSSYFLRESVRGRAGGKGMRDIQAKASALGESIERYSGVFQGDEARIRAKFKDLDAAIHPNACMLFSERQFEQRRGWNKKDSRFNWVPEPFDEKMEIEWSPVWSLTYNELRYVPTAYGYYGYPRRENALFTRADANGCAAGNNKEEATLQGFMELVERDSVALWWYNRLKKPAVDLSSFNEPYFHDLQAYYKTLRLDLWVLDITSDLNIPAFAAISRRNNQELENIMFGFGAHFDPRIALLRAVTELNQLLPAVFHVSTLDTRSQSREAGEWWTATEALDWWNTATVENQPYLVPDKGIPPKIQSDYPKLWSDDLYTDVMNCVEIAQAKGLEMLVLDQTRPDTGLHVVKVIVPGLRHFWARFAPGRLYEVPVQMGWLTEPLHEELLNPKFMFL